MKQKNIFEINKDIKNMYYVKIINEDQDVTPTLLLCHFLPYLGLYPEKENSTSLESTVDIYIVSDVSVEKIINSFPEPGTKKI